MFSVIVVPDGCRSPAGQHRLEPGQTLRFGRAAPADAGLAIPHPRVPRAAGEITATGAFWVLSNFSRDLTYLIADPEGEGEHLSVGPGRADAPVPFEFARVTLADGERSAAGRAPAYGTGQGPYAGAGRGEGRGAGRPGFDVLAPRHDYLGAPDTGDGAGTAPEEPLPVPFPLDHSRRYFLVLAALCEPRLRGGAPDAPPPGVAELGARLRGVWPGVSAAAVAWNLGYLALKLRVPLPGGVGGDGAGVEAREALAALALRLDLVREEQLGVLDGQVAV
ncbi:hypothetical protein [Streptomyces boncukensis]|uniref:FHA domain-containing protein n=1 Tax=Streptomyces boncukensis TaxID=2711219 RepID=A0A6G4X4L7_9ACTN|nr:hypothetical protein [Streptomyces boncukensis]